MPNASPRRNTPSTRPSPFHTDILATDTLAALERQLDALASHPDASVCVEGKDMLRELARIRKRPSTRGYARLDALLLHARIYATPQHRPLFRAPHANARRLFRRALNEAA